MPSETRVPARHALLEGWSLALFFWVALFGVALRGWRIIDGLWGTGRLEELWWIPRTVGVDLAFAALVWVVSGMTLAWPHQSVWGARIARTLSLLAAFGILILGSANVLSFHVSGSALTWQRLRGDDGATVRDVSLIEWADVWPVLSFAAGAALALLVALAQHKRIEQLSLRARSMLSGSLVAAAVVGCACYELAWDHRDRGYGRHYVGIMLESMVQSLRPKPDVLSQFQPPKPSDDGWRALFTPDNPVTPPPPAPAKATQTTKNVIVFFSEGVPLEHTSFNPEGPPTTPRLKARADRAGLVMNRFYSPYHRSIHALFSLLCGEFPPPNPIGITLLNPRIDCGEWSTAFHAAGMKAGFLHGGFFSFYDKGQFLNDREYVILKDATELDEDEQWARNSWGIDDRAMVAEALSWIDSLEPEDRFALVLVPITAHYPFTVPSDVPVPFGTSRKIDRFRNAVFFLDIVFDQLMKGLEERGLLDDTLVMFTADHGESPQEPARVTNVDRAAYEYDVRVPAVLFSSSMFPVPQTSERLASIPDILPTMLEASGATDDRTRQGTSFLSPLWKEKRVFLGTARSNIHQLGFIDGTHKFLLNIDDGQAELYDLVQDPDELNNLAAQHPEFLRRGQEVTLTWGAWQEERLTTWKKLDQPQDIHELLANDFEVTIVDAQGNRTACAPPSEGGSARTCAGQPDGFYPGIVDVTIADATRRCLSVAAPPEGHLELKVTDRDYFHRLSMMQLTRPGNRRASREIRSAVNVGIDGKLFPMEQRKKFPRLPLPHPKNELVVHIATTSRVCLFFSVQAWSPLVGRAPDNHREFEP